MFTTAQLYLCQHMLKNGWPASMKDILLTRCSAQEEELQGLIDAELVECVADRYSLTKQGRRSFLKEKKVRFF